jgi:hypothetical protein
MRHGPQVLFKIEKAKGRDKVHLIERAHHKASTAVQKNRIEVGRTARKIYSDSSS